MERILTSNDAIWVKGLISPTYENIIKDQVDQMLKNGVILGDPTIPTFLRILYYEIPIEQAKLMPLDISAGFNTQIADLHAPLELLDTKFYDTILFPLVLKGLHQIANKYPEALSKPLWAVMPKESTLTFQERYFPTCVVNGGYMVHKTLVTALKEGEAQLLKL